MMEFVYATLAGLVLIVMRVSTTGLYSNTHNFNCLLNIVPVCPEGFFGEHCMSLCDCSSQFVCHAAKGCVCRKGYTGKDCETSSEDAQKIESERESTRSSGATWGVVVALILVATIVLLVLYYKRRERTLKKVISSVEYHANPESPLDRNHFDNPVYLTNDNAQLLKFPPFGDKPTNLERLKRGLCANDDESSGGSSRGPYFCKLIFF